MCQPIAQITNLKLVPKNIIHTEEKHKTTFNTSLNGSLDDFIFLTDNLEIVEKLY